MQSNYKKRNANGDKKDEVEENGVCASFKLKKYEDFRLDCTRIKEEITCSFLCYPLHSDEQ